MAHVGEKRFTLGERVSLFKCSCLTWDVVDPQDPRGEGDDPQDEGAHLRHVGVHAVEERGDYATHPACTEAHV